MKLNRKGLKLSSVGLVIVLGVLLVVTAGSTGVSVSPDGFLSTSTHVTLAVQKGIMGNGEPVPQGVEGGLIGRGGPPVVSIVFDDPVDEEQDALVIYWNNLPTSHVKKKVMVEKNQGQGEAEARAEAECEAEGQVRSQSLEIWTLMSTICDSHSDDPICQAQPILLDNERIEQYGGKDYLVSTAAYIDIHIFSQNPLKFTIRINGLDEGPVTGDWWNQ